MKRSSSLLIFPVLLTFVLFSFTACQKDQAGDGQSTGTDAQQSGQSVTSQIAIPSFEKLDKLPFSDMNQRTIRQSEEGDCENKVDRYTIDNWAVVLDLLSCSEYYRQRTYYQLTEAGDITMVHFQYVEPFVDPDSGTLFYALEEKIVDFTGPEPVMRSRVDTLPKAPSETGLSFEYFSGSQARMIQTKGAIDELERGYWQKKYAATLSD
jgi:hypothetical protein